MAAELTVLEEIKRINASFPYTDPIKKWKASGRKVVGWTCIYVPEEIIHAAGMLPVRVTGDSEESRLEKANAYLYTNSCSYIRSCFDLALAGKFDFLDGLVGSSPCSGVIRLAEVWDHYLKKPPLISILDVPRKVNDRSFDYFHMEVLEFKKRLEKFFGVQVSDVELAKSIALYQETRDLLKKVYDLKKGKNPPISGAETMELLNAAVRMPREEYNALLKELLQEINSSRRALSGDFRLMVSGSVLNNANFIKDIEALGALVVTDEVCTGARYFWEPVDSSLGPLKALSKRYMQSLFPCARTYPPEQRTGKVLEMAEEFKVDGIIALSIRNCAPYIYDLPLWKEKAEAKGIPVLDLSIEYGSAMSGQLKVRVEAFLEMLL